MNRLIRKAINGWIAWRNRKRLHRAIPVLAELDRQQAECRRSHKRGAARIIKARKQAICDALAAGNRTVEG